MAGIKSLGAVKGEDKLRRCPECGSKDVVLNSDDETYCRNCGLVLD